MRFGEELCYQNLILFADTKQAIPAPASGNLIIADWYMYINVIEVPCVYMCVQCISQ